MKIDFKAQLTAGETMLLFYLDINSMLMEHLSLVLRKMILPTRYSPLCYFIENNLQRCKNLHLVIISNKQRLIQNLFEQIFTFLFFIFQFFTFCDLSSPIINSFDEIVKHLYTIRFTEKRKEVLGVKILHRLPLLY